MVISGTTCLSLTAILHFASLHPCVAGPIAAALAVDYDPGVYGLAADVFSRGLQGLSNALASWAPQGVWPEGSRSAMCRS